MTKRQKTGEAGPLASEGTNGSASAALPNPIKSFDARDWARAFVAHVRAIPGLTEDEATMTTWFASALMRGYDEAMNTEIRKAISRT
jgi:hypothetical protein